MLYSVILTIHIIVCLVLIAVILLQAGRGGGVADVGSAPSVLGTQGTTLLTRATTACAVIFMMTSIGLAMLSAQKGRSLMTGVRVVNPAAVPQTPAAAAPAQTPPPATEPTPVNTKS